MMRDSEEALDGGSSIMIFPEGTRSADGNLRPFKSGAFELAWRTHSPVLPIVIDGTAHALPRRGILLEPGQRIRVRVLPPILPDSAPDAEGLNHLVHTTIAHQLADLRAHSPGA
jgi:1-acyl-sn-glycerol-3-phosphate acyltransferase